MSFTRTLGFVVVALLVAVASAIADLTTPEASPLLRTQVPLHYYFDVEPKEQKYLRLGTDYETMVRRRSQLEAHNRVAPQQLLLDGAPSQLLSVVAARAGPLLLPSAQTAAETSAVAAAAEDAMRSELAAKSVRQLRRLLNDKGSDCDGCVEKFHLVEKILETRGWLSREDTVALMLTALQESMTVLPQPHHLGLPLSDAETKVLTDAVTHKAEVLRRFDCDERNPSVNGTVTCTPRARAF